METTQPPQTAALAPTRAALLKQLIPSLFFALGVGWFLSTPGFGFMVYFVILGQIFLIPIRLYRALTHRQAWLTHIARILIWLAVIASTFAIHDMRDAERRAYAKELIAKIETYTTSRGKCPASSSDVGITREEMRDKLGRDGYSCRDGEQLFFYDSSMSAFTHWFYRFETHRWEYHAD